MKLPVIGKTYFDARVGKDNEVVPIEKTVTSIGNGFMIVWHGSGYSYAYPMSENWQDDGWMYDTFLDAVAAYELTCSTVAAYEENEIRESQLELSQRIYYHEARWQYIPLIRAKLRELQDEAAR
jgi:hypothetical protein